MHNPQQSGSLDARPDHRHVRHSRRDLASKWGGRLATLWRLPVLMLVVSALLLLTATITEANIFKKLSKKFPDSPYLGGYGHDYAGPAKFNHEKDVASYETYPGPLSANYGFNDGYHNERVHALYTYYRRRR